MISTSSYKNCESDKYRLVSISRDKGSSAGFNGPCYPALAPKMAFWQKWHDNIGVIPEEQNTRYYVEEYYRQVLSKLDPVEVYRELDNSILVCYEDSGEFCHRHIVAAWFGLLLGDTIQPVNEIAIEGYQVTRLEDSGAGVRDMLEDVIRNTGNMRGFTSVRARYLFEIGEELEAHADKYEETTGKSGDEYRESACFYRCEADDAELQYKTIQRQKKRQENNYDKKY